MTQTKFQNAKIVIIDDDPGNIRVLERILRYEGYYHVSSTTDSTQAAKLYEEVRPDIILLDLKMPRMNGFDVLRQLNEVEKRSYLPVLILTAQQDRTTRLKALEAGAKDFLNKPFDTAEALLRISNIIETHLLHKEIRNQNRNLEEKVRERTWELRQTQLEIINRLGRASEYRDNETGMHIVRMSRLSARLAHALGMSNEECDLILNASPMHDVGKIGIPDHILLKPGKLNDDEWKIMKTHPAMGAEMLAGGHSELMLMAQLIAISHQERWDGSGYPKGLKGEEIPLAGRIVAVCDVFDALTSARPYKKAFSVEDSIAEIEKQSGKLFEPRLVEAFKKTLPDMLKIIKECSDSKGNGSGRAKLNGIFEPQEIPLEKTLQSIKA